MLNKIFAQYYLFALTGIYLLLSILIFIMEPTTEKSQEQANIISSIAIQIYFLDVEYLREAAKRFRDQASRQESMAVLNPRYTQTSNDIIRVQAKALMHLCDYVDSLKEVEKLKKDLQLEESNQELISKMFM